MTISPPFKLAAAAAAFSFMAAVAPAHAGVVATFDPPYGPSIPNLGFRGTILLDVSAGCYQDAATGPGYYTGSEGCTITAQSATINYYNSTTNATGSPTGPGAHTSVALDSTFFPTNYVTGGFFDATGNLAGFDTGDSVPFLVNVSDAGTTPTPVTYNGYMELYFTSGLFGAAATAPSAFLRACPNNTTETCTDPNRQNTNQGVTTSAASTVTFKVVPEPATISLAALGLAGLAVARRRRRSVSIGIDQAN